MSLRVQCCHATITALLLKSKGLAVPASYYAEAASSSGRIWRLGLALASSSSAACACICAHPLLLRNPGELGP